MFVFVAYFITFFSVYKSVLNIKRHKFIALKSTVTTFCIIYLYLVKT